MNCEKIKDSLSAYLDEEMNASNREVVAGHLQECSSCKAFFEGLAAQEARLRELSDLPLPETDPEQAVRYWRAATSTAPVQRRRFLTFFGRYMAAPLAAAATVALVFSLRSDPDYRHLPLEPEQLQVLQSTSLQHSLKYRIGVVLTDLHNLPETESVAHLKGKIIQEDFLGSIAAVKTQALQNGDQNTLRLFIQLEMILLSIINDEPSSRQMAQTIRL